MPRSPARDRYDAILDFHPQKTIPETAYVLVKVTYQIEKGICVRTEPQPLQFDLRDDTLQPRMPPGSDFWVVKLGTDVVVQGSAWAPNRRPTGKMDCSVEVGRQFKKVRVFGNRSLQWLANGSIVISEPEPFLEMPLTYENAYGGIDPRVPMKLPSSPEELKRFDIFDHPGLYPRNLHGRGYLVLPDPVPGALLPNLEDPDDLLTPERLVVRDPALWYRQPMPWCFDYTNMLMFPRMAYGGLRPAFPVPSAASLPEVLRGLVPEGFAAQCDQSFDPSRPPAAQFYQEASIGLGFGQLQPQTPMAVEGMHPYERRLEWELPAPPSIEVTIERQRVPVTVRLTSCVVQPTDKRLMLVYCAVVDKMPRTFIPGIHKEIPFSAVIDGDSPLRYEAPVPVREQTIRGRA